MSEERESNEDTSDQRQGVLYFAIGESYVEEAKESLCSLREHMDLPAAIVTDNKDYDLEVFDYVTILEEGTKRVERKQSEGEMWVWDTPLKPEWSPFEYTLYLDTDTYICADLSELFKLLENYDLAVPRLQQDKSIDSLPEPARQEYQCGVIAYRNTPAVRELFNRWNLIFHYRVKIQDRPMDQPAFAEALYTTDIKYFNLPTRYDLRITRRGRHGAIVGEPKILHGRADLERVADVFEEADTSQQYTKHVYRKTTWGDPITLRPNEPVTRLENAIFQIGSKMRGFHDLFGSFVKSLGDNGFRSTLNKTLQYLGVPTKYPHDSFVFSQIYWLKRGKVIAPSQNGYQLRGLSSKKDAWHFPEFTDHYRFTSKKWNQLWRDYFNSEFAPLEEGDVVVDVGSYIGTSPIMASKKAKKVYAVEPSPRAISFLKKNIHYYNNIEIMQYAAWNKSEEIELKLGKSPSEDGLIEPDDGGNDNSVGVQAHPTSKIIELTGEKKIDFLKVEAEGVEPEVIEGIGDSNINKIAVVGNEERYGKPTYKKVEDILKEKGYDTELDLGTGHKMVYGRKN